LQFASAARAGACRASSAHSVAARFRKSRRAAISSRRLFRSGAGERNRAQPLSCRHTSNYFFVTKMGGATFPNRKRSAVANNYAADARSNSIDPGKSLLHRRRCPRGRTVYRRRNLLRAPLRRTGRECNCKNQPRRRSTIDLARIRSGTRRDVSRTTLDQSTGARCSLIAAHCFIFRARRPNSAIDFATAYEEDCCRHALTVFDISIAIVIGPTPPGTGVIAATFFETSSNATSPTRR